MHRRFGVLYLGEIHTWTKLERYRHVKRRPRTHYKRAVRAGASSDLHWAAYHVRRNRDRAWARRCNHRNAIGVRRHLDQTAARRKTHAPEISRAICCVPTAGETANSIYPLAVLSVSRFAFIFFLFLILTS